MSARKVTEGDLLWEPSEPQFVGSSPILPVHAGESQCRAPRGQVEAFDKEGRPMIDQVGELVITEPLPSTPLFLWGDSATVATE